MLEATALELLGWEVNYFTCILNNEQYIFFTASYDPNLPVTIVITSGGDTVAGGSFTLTCDDSSTAMNPAYEWFDESGTSIGTEGTLTLNPLLESHSGEYSCLVTDQTRNVVGCGVYRVTVQGMDYE